MIAASAPPGRAEELTVAAAVSLREPLEAIASRFEAEHPGTRVQLALGATSALAAQARAGAPLDVIVAADEETIATLAAEGLVKQRSSLPIAGNRLVVIVTPELAEGITHAADLTRSELRRIALPAPAVPLGRYAREWLAGRGLLAQLEPRLVTTEHARATLAAVDGGHADAGIVYASDARTARTARVAFTPAASEQPRIVYVAAPLAAARTPALAEAFVTALRGEAAQRDLTAAGFTRPAEAPR